MEFSCEGTREGNLEFGYYGKEKLRQYILSNPGVRFKMMPILPESGRQRRYFEGAIIPLVAFYQEGMDHKNSDDLRKVREWLKAEFNGELVVIAGRAAKVGRSTKGRQVLPKMIERVQDWIIDNYAPPVEAMDPATFKKWRQSIAPFGGPDNFIDYLCELNILSRG